MLKTETEIVRNLRGNTIRTKLTLQLKGNTIDEYSKSNISEGKKTCDMPNRSSDENARFLVTYKQYLILRARCMHLTMVHTCSPYRRLFHPHALSYTGSLPTAVNVITINCRFTEII